MLTCFVRACRSLPHIKKQRPPFLRTHGESQSQVSPTSKPLLEATYKAETSRISFPYTINLSSGSRFFCQPMLTKKTESGSTLSFKGSSFEDIALLSSNRESKFSPNEAGKMFIPVQEPQLVSRGKEESSSVWRQHLGYYYAAAGLAGLALLAAAPTIILNRNETDKSYIENAGVEGFVSSSFEALRHSSEKLAKGLVSGVSSLYEKILETTFEIMDAGATAVVLFRCLVSVLESAGEGAASGWPWRARVAALVADLCAAGENRRRAVVQAGNGAVVDWLLEVVGKGRQATCKVTQAEAARALSYLLADEATCEAVLARPHVVPSLLRFASALQPMQIQSHGKKSCLSEMDVQGSRGKSQLVASIMDIVTLSCDPESEAPLRPKLPRSAYIEDIAEALEVIKKGGLLLKDDTRDGVSSSGPKDRDSGKGIGIKAVGGTVLLGLQRSNQETSYKDIFSLSRMFLQNIRLLFGWIDLSTNVEGSFNSFSSSIHHNLSKLDRNYSAYGLWDDLQSGDVAVPLAAWAVATWADASTANQAKIVELDKDGQALLSALLAPERTVKWHGASAIHLLMQNRKPPLEDVTQQWSAALLDIAAQACKLQDSLLADSALSALISCVKESNAAKSFVLVEGLPIMRGLAKQTEADTIVQRALAEALFVTTESGNRMPVEESKKWSAILLRWVCGRVSEKKTRSFGSSVLNKIVEDLGRSGIPISQAWLAMLLMDLVKASQEEALRQKKAILSKEAKARGPLQNEMTHSATQVAAQLAKIVADEAAAAEVYNGVGVVAESVAELPMADLFGLDVLHSARSASSKEQVLKVSVADAASAVLKAIKAVTELCAENQDHQNRIIEAGGLCLLRRLLLEDDYEQWAAAEAEEFRRTIGTEGRNKKQNAKDNTYGSNPPTSHLHKHAARLLLILSSQPEAVKVVLGDQHWCKWLQKCARGELPSCRDLKVRSYAHMTLCNSYQTVADDQVTDGLSRHMQPRYTDMIYLLNLDTRTWNYQPSLNLQLAKATTRKTEDVTDGPMLLTENDEVKPKNSFCSDFIRVEVAGPNTGAFTSQQEKGFEPVMDVVFVHGLCGGPFKTWRVAKENPSLSIPSRVIENIVEDSGIEGSCWPCEWLPNDIPQSRVLTIKYKTNLSQWSGATLPLEEVSSMLLEKLLAAGVGERPVAFITHSMGGLVVKQMLFKAAQDQHRSQLLKRTSGIIFYSCPHFGSKLADMPWRMGLLLRPAPSIGELRSGSPRLEELNHFIRQLHHKGDLQVLSFSETKVTPLVEGYGGWALRMEVVPIESAYPGYGDLVVLDGIDHVSSCKPVSYTDPAYMKAVEFLQKLETSACRTSQ